MSTICNRIVGVDPMYLIPEDYLVSVEGFDSLTVEEMPFKTGDRVRYTGEPMLVTAPNGISSLHDPDGKPLYLGQGTRLTICRNQFGKEGVVTYKNVFDQPRIRCHFRLEAIPVGEHGNNCRCGACGHVWKVLDGCECTCDQEEAIDQGKQECVIS